MKNSALTNIIKLAMPMKFIILCSLLPGFGYLRLGQVRYFYAFVIMLYSVIVGGSLFRLFPTFAGFVALLFLMCLLHFGTAFHAILKLKELKGSQKNPGLRIALSGLLLLLTVTCFGNSASVMGFDRVSMAVPVMEPAIRTGEQLLVDTWIHASKQIQRGDIIIHRFSGQKGIYLNRVIGQKGSNLIMQDSNFKRRALYDIKNQYTVLYIFKSDCGSCKKETPKLVEFYDRKEFDLEVFAVSADTSMVKMRNYIKEMNMRWITVNGPRTYVGPYQDLYDANTTPTIYVLDQEKKIIAKKIPAEKIGEFLMQYEKIRKQTISRKM